MEKLELQKNNEELVETEKKPLVVFSEDADKLEAEIKYVADKIKTNEEAVVVTTQKIENIRSELGLTGEIEIPSIDFSKNNITKLEDKKQILKGKLLEILKSDVSLNYNDIIEKIKQSKIDWANSKELERRLRLKGAEAEDIINIKKWLIDNAKGVRTFVLPQNQYNELRDIISEMTGDGTVLQGDAFYSPGGRDDLPEEAKNAVFMKEKIIPNMQTMNGVIPEKRSINDRQLSHELGHATQDGLLGAEQFANEWNPKFKGNAPDKEYIGQIEETDTRIRSMFNTLGSSYDPEKEVFGRKHLEILKEKQKNNLLDKDTKDLLNHYDDIELVKLANRMPAI